MILRRPLLLAIALPLVPALLGLAVLLGTRQPTTASKPAATTTAQPTPTRTPVPTPLPALIPDDDFTVAGAHAYGKLDITGYDERDNLVITSYALAATPASMPSTLPVWKLRGFNRGDTAALQARFATLPPTPDVSVDLDAGHFSAGTGNVSTLLTVGSQPQDDQAALNAATQLLHDLGLAMHNTKAQVNADGDTHLPGWQVSYARTPIDGVAVGIGGWNDSVADIEINTYGNVTRVRVDAPAVAGGSPYTLRSWRDAWTEVTRGHWYTECCEVFTGAAPGPRHTAFRADQISLRYDRSGGTGMYLIPMYAFTDTVQKLTLEIPALRLADLAEPGGFKLTEPGGG